MSVPLILHVFPTFQVGGSQMRFATLANHFGPAFQHRILALDGDYAASDLLMSQVDWATLPRPSQGGTTITNVWRYRNVLRTLRPSLLVTYNWGAIEWALANWIKVVAHLHVEDGFGPEEAIRQFRRRILMRRLALSRSEAILLPSRRLFDIATSEWRLPARRLRYVPNGIDCARFAAPADPSAVAMIGLEPDEIVIGTIASLRAEKNLGRLIDAFSRIAAKRPARLVIVGDGAERGRLEAQAANTGLSSKVVFTGRIASPERMIGCFDIFALSSDTEQMPISVLEAMAAGLPLVSTDVGDVRLMLPEENHAFVVPKDVSALAQALSSLADDPDRRRTIGQTNQARARDEYSQERMFTTWEALLRMGQKGIS